MVKLWTDPEDQELERLWVQETPYLTTTRIGEIMGKSKNKVVGRAHRLGLPKRKNTPPRKRLAIAQPERPKPIRALVPRAAPRLKRNAPIEPVNGGQGVCILEAGPDQCRGIVGHGPAGLARYCGAPVAMRPVRHRGQIVVGPDGSTKLRPLAWCEGHASRYLDPR